MGHLARREVKVLTFVVHAFMDASIVTPAWEQLQSGQEADDPNIREAQERLRACVYSMAHPETGEIVPACVQHSVLDPGANRHLAVLLPHPTLRPTLPGPTKMSPVSETEPESHHDRHALTDSP